MARDWESTFTSWAQGPSPTEQAKAENAERQIREAISASPKLRARNIKVFTQGSYRNRVNVVRDSDVDIGILCYDAYFAEYPDDNVKAIVESKTMDSVYTYQTFKNEIEEALVGRFGRPAVTRGKKAFDIKANTYRVDADVAAFFEHRRYTSQTYYLSGVEMIPDDHNPLRIRNWPEQHYSNGVSKNEECGKRFKRVVRVLKSLSNEMKSAGVQAAKPIPSFLVECLCWNTPNFCLTNNEYKETIKSTLAHLIVSTNEESKCSEWGEVSELKYLFRPSQPWTRHSAYNFVLAAWQYIGY